MSVYQTPFVLAIDIGTSGTKAIVFDSQGRRTEAKSTKSYDFHFPVENAAEFDPDVIVSAVVNASKEAVKKSKEIYSEEIKAVGLSGFWHSLICVGKDNKPLTPLYTWADRRSYPQSLKLRKVLNNTTVQQRTGCPLHPVYLPSKILWLREEKKDVFQETKLFCSMKEYLILRFFGKSVCDFSTASGSGLLNIKNKEWDKEILETIGISENQLSSLVDFNYRLEGLNPHYANLIGILSSVPWFIGLGDGACSSIGSGCTSEKRIALMVGTSGALRVMTEQKVANIPSGLWCYLSDKNHYLVGGAINNAGLVRNWLRKTLNLSPEKETERIISQRRPGAHGLIFLPFLAGERCPGWQANAEGLLKGLKINTSPEDIFHAGLEAVGYRLLEIYSLINKIFPDEKEVVVSGGIVKSPAWIQIIADILGVSLVVSSEKEASSKGAAILILKALGLIDGFTVPENRKDKIKVFEPLESNHSFYLERYKQFESLYHNCLDK